MAQCVISQKNMNANSFMRICAYHIIKQLSLIRNDIFSENITKNGPIAILKIFLLAVLKVIRRI